MTKDSLGPPLIPGSRVGSVLGVPSVQCSGTLETAGPHSGVGTVTHTHEQGVPLYGPPLKQDSKRPQSIVTVGIKGTRVDGSPRTVARRTTPTPTLRPTRVVWKEGSGEEPGGGGVTTPHSLNRLERVHLYRHRPSRMETDEDSHDK